MALVQPGCYSRQSSCFQGFVKLRVLPLWQWALGREGTALHSWRLSQPGFSTSRNAPLKCRGSWQCLPCSWNSWALWRSWWVQQCWFVSGVECAQGAPVFFRALWGVIPVHSHAGWYFTETLAQIYETLLESFDTTRNSRSHKNMWNSPSYFSATALRIQCSNCALRHQIMIQQLRPRVKNSLSNSDPKGDLGQVIFHN